MSTNVSKEKREQLVAKIKAIKSYIASAPQDENTARLLAYIADIEKDIKGKKYGLVFEEHREAIDEILEQNTPVLTEEKDLFIDNGGQMNFLIEGDNLAALQLLEKTHKGKIDLIYIDPPYNTGNKDFIYDDNFVDANDTFRHSKWLSFMQKRLEIAKRLLSENGVIFISIDDNEQSTLKMICDDIFGESNFIAQFTRKGSGGRQDSKYFAIVHEYLLCYAKNGDNFVSGKISVENEDYPFFDEEKGLKYKLQLLRKWGENSKRENRPNLFYPITDPDGNEHYPMISDTEDGCWRWGKEKMQEEIKNGRVEFKKGIINGLLMKKYLK